MSEDAHRCGCDHLVKGETEERPKPAPEEKLQLLDDEKGNENRTEKTDDCCGYLTIGDDDRDKRREDSK